MSADAPKLSVAGLQAGYGDVQVLWDVSLEVGGGELVCIIGSNGAGKTTLMRCLSGLLTPSSGEIAVDGRTVGWVEPLGLAAPKDRLRETHRADRAMSDGFRLRSTHPTTSRQPADFVRAGIAHVPEGRRLFAAMSVRDNLLMGAYLRDGKQKIASDLERVYAMFPVLAERRRQDAGTLSGGEQQMCAIGRGLMAAPSLLLIDELSLGLAPRAVELLVERLRAINRAGVAILLVEQDVVTALELADRAYVIDHGRMVKTAPARELINDPVIRQAYMGLA